MDLKNIGRALLQFIYQFVYQIKAVKSFHIRLNLNKPIIFLSGQTSDVPLGDSSSLSSIRAHKPVPQHMCVSLAL